MQVIFWTKDNFCFNSDCRKSFNCKLKKLINEQIIIFYSPSNTLCSSEESVQIKHFKHHTLTVCVSFLLSSICKYWVSLARNFNKVTSWWTLWAADPRNFYNSFLLKTIIWTWFFFQVLQSVYRRKKYFLEKDASNVKIAWHTKRKKKNIEKRKGKTKNEKNSNNNNRYFFTFTFSRRKFYILLENIFGKT